MHFKVQEANPTQELWLIGKLGLQTTSAFRAIVALDSQNRIRGGVGYDRWSAGHGSVELHCAVEHPAAWLALIGPGLQYPFEQAYGTGVGLVYATVQDTNHAIKVFLSRLGWTMAHRLRGGWSPDVDLLIFEMRKQDWYSLRASHEVGPVLKGHEGRAA